MILYQIETSIFATTGSARYSDRCAFLSSFNQHFSFGSYYTRFIVIVLKKKKVFDDERNNLWIRRRLNINSLVRWLTLLLSIWCGGTRTARTKLSNSLGGPAEHWNARKPGRPIRRLRFARPAFIPENPKRGGWWDPGGTVQSIIY